MFNHIEAQDYEKKYADGVVLNDFLDLYKRWEECKKNGGLWQDQGNQWFQGDLKAWNKFVKYIKTKKCVEIGSGPFGFLSPCYWLKDRVIIDPLIDHYKQFQLKSFQKTLFTEDIKTYNVNAETLIEELIGNVNGLIVCRNALDHCIDPMMILDNVAKYATKGCYFLLWTDIWHLDRLDAGHRNITASEIELDNKMKEIGFKLLKEGQKIRNPNQFIEYGRMFKKV